MYHQRRLEKWGFDWRYITQGWNRISVRFQYEAMRRGIFIYTPWRNLHMLDLRFMMWRQLPELFFGILGNFNFNIAIRRWRTVRVVRTFPDSDTSLSTNTTSTATTKATMNVKSSSTTTSCSYCVDTKCLILGIVLTYSSCRRFELAKISNEQIVEFIKILFGNW